MKTLGIDLGGTRIKFGVAEDGRVLAEDRCDTLVNEGYQAVLDRLAAGADKLLAQFPDIRTIGMGVPGVIDADKSVVCYSNNFGWRDAPLGKDMEERLGRRIKLANDAQCAALGEALYGAGQGFARMAMVTLGTGVGGGFVKDGRLETDRYGSMAYIFGHAVVDARGRMCSCNRQGCLEAYASAGALEKKSGSLYEQSKTAKEIFAAARDGEQGACKILEEFVEYLGIGLVNIANILRPQMLVIGGGVSASGDMFIEKIREEVKKGVYGYEYAPVEVACAKLGNSAGIVGAACL